MDDGRVSTGTECVACRQGHEAHLRGMDPILHQRATEWGLSRGALRSRAFAQPTVGVSLPADQVGDLGATCRAIALALPADAMFTHVTAAALRGWWLPALAELPIIACTDGFAPHLDRRGVFVRRCQIPQPHRRQVGDLRVASPAWVVAELAEHLALVDLVVAIDGALHMGHLTSRDLATAVIPGRRGVRTLRQAVLLADGRAESPWETVLRLLHRLAGVDVVPQHVVAGADGEFIARADLWVRGTRRLPEYDGAVHRDRNQHQADLAREKALARAGFERYGYVAREILTDPGRIIRDADLARGVQPDRRRVDAWRTTIDASSFSRRGMAELETRLRRFQRDSAPRSKRAASPRVALT